MRNFLSEPSVRVNTTSCVLASCLTVYLPNPATERHRFATSAPTNKCPTSINAQLIAWELSPNFGDGLKDQAAAWARGAAELPRTSIPSVNLTPWISFGNWLWPSMRRQFFCAPSTSLKTMASAVLFDRQPFDPLVAVPHGRKGAFNGVRRS
jgi:hypothetical protein